MGDREDRNVAYEKPSFFSGMGFIESRKPSEWNKLEIDGKSVENAPVLLRTYAHTKNMTLPAASVG